MDFFTPIELLTDAQERLPKLLAWVLWPVLAVVALVYGLARFFFTVTLPLLLADLLGFTLLRGLPEDTGMYVFLVLLGLFIWQVVQTERLRSRLGHVESILDDMRHYSVETEEEAG